MAEVLGASRALIHAASVDNPVENKEKFYLRFEGVYSHAVILLMAVAFEGKPFS